MDEVRVSRQKGNAAEREVAKLIEPWWQKLDPDAKFCRTPLSGGWGGPSLRAGFGAAGDLMTTSKTFPFTIEVKRREGWTWKRLLDAGKPSPVWGWWEQAQTQALEMNKIPCLWFRKNREKHWSIFLPRYYVENIGAFDYQTWNMANLNVGIEPALFEHADLLKNHPKVFVVER